MCHNPTARDATPHALEVLLESRNQPFDGKLIYTSLIGSFDNNNSCELELDGISILASKHVSKHHNDPNMVIIHCTIMNKSLITLMSVGSEKLEYGYGISSYYNDGLTKSDAIRLGYNGTTDHCNRYFDRFIGPLALADFMPKLGKKALG